MTKQKIEEPAMNMTMGQDYTVMIFGFENPFGLEAYEQPSMVRYLSPEKIPGVQDLYHLIEGASKTIKEAQRFDYGFIITKPWTHVPGVIRTALDIIVESGDALPQEIGLHEKRFRAIIAQPQNEEARRKVKRIKRVHSNNPQGVRTPPVLPCSERVKTYNFINRHM